MKFLKKIWVWITLILSGLKKVLHEIVIPAIQVVNEIKNVVNSPALDLVVDLTKFQWDNVLLDAIRNVLPSIINSLQVADILDEDTPEAMFEKLLSYLKELPPEQRSWIYSKIASRLVQALDPEVKEAEADTLVQLAYIHQKGKD